MQVRMATSTTAGTKYEDTTSARRWMGARLRCASLTMRTICARSVSLPTRSVRTTQPPVPFTVPPVTGSPGNFSTGIGSPVTIDSSTALVPSSTTPSTGTFSPGRTRRRSPGCRRSRGKSSSLPSSRSRRAVFGARPSRALMALLVWLRAQFENLSQQDERRNDRCGLEVHGHFPTMRAEGVRKETGHEGRDHTVDVGGACADRDECEHVQAAVDEGGPPARKERPAPPEYDRRREDQLHPGEETRGECMVHRSAWQHL